MHFNNKNICECGFDVILFLDDVVFSNILGEAMPQAVTVTPEEREAIERVTAKLGLNFFSLRNSFLEIKYESDECLIFSA